ncbi:MULTISPECIES: hypothetical protein [Kribbella]|uniref:hypothetical protein n=1 Tax=Kribbella TaxID=182639 RepID=UPI001048380F|nr:MULTISPECIES: hypothetical protein [Kribbella]
MSTPREELHALIDSLPESAAADLLAELRLQRLRPDGAEEPADQPSAAWPPSWFGAVEGSRPDLSEHIDDILRAEFGRRPA